MVTSDAVVTGGAMAAGYPPEWEFDGLLRNGEAVVVRPIQPGDAPALVGLRANVPPGTHQHELLASPILSLAQAARFSEVDYDARMAFVAVVSDELVGLASYDRPDTRVPAAEASFIVAGARQGHGVTTLLFESLAEYARTMGILRFTAEVRAQNAALLELFAATGLHFTRHDGPATVRVEIDLRPTAAYRASCDQREAMAEVASIAAILRPGSVAVVGAGRHPGNVGHQVVQSLLAGDFSGTVYPVNPSARAVSGVPAFPALLSVPEPVDLAMVAVPAPAVPAVIDEAASMGVRAVTIITAGFGETGRSGAAVETEMLSMARRHGMRIVGPNCLGVINTDPGIRMRRHLCPARSAARAAGPGFAVRCGRGPARRADARRWPGPVGLRLGREQAGREPERPAVLFRARRPDLGHRALPGVAGQPAQVRPHRPAGRRDEAHRGAEGGPDIGRRPGSPLAHGRRGDPGSYRFRLAEKRRRHQG